MRLSQKEMELEMWIFCAVTFFIRIYIIYFNIFSRFYRVQHLSFLFLFSFSRFPSLLHFFPFSNLTFCDIFEFFFQFSSFSAVTRIISIYFLSFLSVILIVFTFSHPPSIPVLPFFAISLIFFFTFCWILLHFLHGNKIHLGI